jgi:RNA polymerase sigma-70 factor (ECF subfamily)
MERGSGTSANAPADVTIYCVVPQRLPEAVFEAIRSHYRHEHSVEVVMERRGLERRSAPERRMGELGEGEDGLAEERRRIRNITGRRIGERRAELATAADLPAPLPREVARYAGELVFLFRQAPSAADEEDRDSARLVTRYQAGDEAAFAELYMRYFNRIYSYLRMALHQDQDAQDATQDVFTRVLIALPRYERRGPPFRAWLFTIVRNLALDRLRQQHRIELLDPANLPDDGVADQDRPALAWISDRRLLLLIERLPEPQRQVLILRYMLDLGTSEIAEIMKLAPNHVSVLHFRALRFLRERLDRKQPRGEPGEERSHMRRLRHASPVTTSRRLALAY